MPVPTALPTPFTPVQLELYRENHRIRSTRDYNADLQRMVDVCEHDGIRLVAQRGRWIHDPSEIRELAILERNGGVIDWTVAR